LFLNITYLSNLVVIQQNSVLLESHVSISECNFVLSGILTPVGELCRTIAAVERVTNEVDKLLMLLELSGVHEVFVLREILEFSFSFCNELFSRAE
jgi:hypothetical protein